MAAAASLRLPSTTLAVSDWATGNGGSASGNLALPHGCYFKRSNARLWLNPAGNKIDDDTDRVSLCRCVRQPSKDHDWCTGNGVPTPTPMHCACTCHPGFGGTACDIKLTSPPTPAPTAPPTPGPTNSPTQTPTLSSSSPLTQTPTLSPSSPPTQPATLSPSSPPTRIPSISPTSSAPTQTPSSQPTPAPVVTSTTSTFTTSTTVCPGGPLQSFDTPLENLRVDNAGRARAVGSVPTIDRCAEHCLARSACLSFSFSNHVNGKSICSLVDLPAAGSRIVRDLRFVHAHRRMSGCRTEIPTGAPSHPATLSPNSPPTQIPAMPWFLCSRCMSHGESFVSSSCRGCPAGCTVCAPMPIADILREPVTESKTKEASQSSVHVAEPELQKERRKKVKSCSARAGSGGCRGRGEKKMWPLASPAAGHITDGSRTFERIGSCCRGTNDGAGTYIETSPIAVSNPEGCAHRCEAAGDRCLGYEIEPAKRGNTVAFYRCELHFGGPGAEKAVFWTGELEPQRALRAIGWGRWREIR